MKTSVLSILIFLCTASLLMSAQEPAGPMKKEISLPQISTDLKPGAGKDKVEVLCNICHSVDYIVMQPLSSQAVWTGSVNKMRKVFGAPINDADAELITGYLTKQYGIGK